MAKYWDISKTLSYNCLFNFIYGIRGAGKTYTGLQHYVKRYLRTGKRFMYLRRTEDAAGIRHNQAAGVPV